MRALLLLALALGSCEVLSSTRVGYTDGTLDVPGGSDADRDIEAVTVSVKPFAKWEQQQIADKVAESRPEPVEHTCGPECYPTMAFDVPAPEPVEVVPDPELVAHIWWRDRELLAWVTGLFVIVAGVWTQRGKIAAKLRGPASVD